MKSINNCGNFSLELKVHWKKKNAFLT